MRRDNNVSIVQLLVVVPILISAGVADAQQMKVACVGDSITAFPTGWCGYLGTKLGSGYTAQTFGVSGTTLLKNVGQPAYSSSDQYQPSHDFAPNIVVIMLGTNDSAPRNWDAGKDHFVQDYEELIDSYTSLATKPMVFLNTPPPASDDNMFTISGTTIANEINPLIKQVAMNKMCPLVDVWAAFDGDVEKIGSFDGVHPGDAGQMTIAETVYQAIKSPIVPGGDAGTGASAGSGGSESAGSGGMAGGSAGSGGSANAGSGGMAGGSANTGGAGAGGGSANAGSGGTTSGSAGASSSANTAGSAGLAGIGGSAGAAGNPSVMVNPIGAAGTSAPPVSKAESSGCGCRMAGNPASKSGPAIALLLLLGILIRRKKRRDRLAGRGLLLIVLLCAACSAERKGSPNPQAPTVSSPVGPGNPAPVSPPGTGVAGGASPGTAGTTPSMSSAAPNAGMTGAMAGAGGAGAMAAAGTTGAGAAGAAAAAGSGGAAGAQPAGTGGQAGAPSGTGTCTASKAVSTTATGTGPHKVIVETNSDSGIAAGTIFRPMDLGGAEKYPIFAWGEGGCLQDGLSNAAVMGEIASHGYFVIADGTPNGTSSGSLGGDTVAMGKPLLAYIAWAIAENDKPCSAYYQSLDTTKTATNGFSCGGLMAEGTAGDPRITTWGLNSSGLFSADQALYMSVHTPVLIVLGGPDDIAYQNGENDYDAISALGVPIMLFSKSGSNHGGDLFNGQGDFAKIDLAWLNWWLKGDETATGKGVLVGSSCTYCTDSTWEVKSQNLP